MFIEKCRAEKNTLIKAGIKIKISKKISSVILKSSLDKSKHVKEAKNFSENIPKGVELLNCPLCQCNNKKLVQTIYGFNYEECLGCGVLYVSNPPNNLELKKAYESEYYTKSNKLLLANDAIIDYRVNEIFKPKIDFVIGELGEKFKHKTWLDIGCGVGEALYAAKKRGFEVRGIEPNEMEAEYAEKKFGVKVYREFLSVKNRELIAGKCNVISLFSVLEHIIDPPALLHETSAVQEKGDLLVIEVPKWPSLSCLSQIAFPNQINRMLHPPFHLFMFPILTLKNLIENNGYKVKSAWVFGQDIYELFSTLSLNAPELDGPDLKNALLSLTQEFQKVVDKNLLGDEMLMIAEKQS